jgi:hypothetical protein
MTYNAKVDIEAATVLSLISPIPLIPKKSAADLFSEPGSPSLQPPLTRMSTASSRASPHQMASNWISPPIQQSRQSIGDVSSKSMVSSMQRSDMSREVYHLIRDNLPQSIKATTALPKLILISRSIEKKLYQSAPSCNAYLNLDTLKLRIAALACAVLIHSEEEKGSSRQERSETCSKLLAAARNSLQHCCMVLVSYETREIEKRFTGGVSLED